MSMTDRLKTRLLGNQKEPEPKNKQKIKNPKRAQTKAQKAEVARKKSAKATRAQSQERVYDVMDMLVRGLPRRDIVRYAAKYWGIGSRQVDKYIKHANTRLERVGKRLEHEMKAKVKNRLESQFHLADANVDLAERRQALALMIKFYGLGAPNKVAFTDPTGQHEATRPEELRQHVEEQLDQILARIEFIDSEQGS